VTKNQSDNEVLYSDSHQTLSLQTSSMYLAQFLILSYRYSTLLNSCGLLLFLQTMIRF